MKKLFTGAMVVLLSIGAAHAQVTPQKDTAKKEHKMVYAQLNLTATQKQKMQELRAAHKKRMDDLKSANLPAEETKKQKHQLNRQHKGEVAAILTDEQKKQLASIRADRKKNSGLAKGKKGKAQTAQRQAQLAKDLNLSTDQQEKISSIRKEYRTKFQQVRNNEALTDAQKKEERKTLMKAQHAQVKSVLTKEQAEKLQTIRKERAAKNTK